jgi:hypothetical protein
MAESVHSVDRAPASMQFEAKTPSAPPPRAAWKLLLPVAILVAVAVVVLLLLGNV